MKSLTKLFLVSLSVLTLVASCTSRYESEGNKAYDQAQRTQGGQRLIHLKSAFMHYRQAVVNNPDNVSKRLRNRFIEMALVRVQMVLEEGGADMPAVPLLVEDIDRFLSEEVSDELHQDYAMFLTLLADTSIAKQHYNKALTYIDKALEVASNPAPIQQKRNSVTSNVAQENLEMAKMNFENAKGDKENVQDLTRAEYNAQAALYFDSTLSEAKELLSEIRRENVGNYSAYVSVMRGYTDTTLFKAINEWDILMAVPAVQHRGNRTTLLVNIYNYSWNALRMRSTDFTLVDVNGEEYQALKTDMGDYDMLDQEREYQYELRFPKPRAEIKKLVYRNGKHHAEKLFL